MSPGCLYFAKLVMMSSAPAKSAGDARHASQGGDEETEINSFRKPSAQPEMKFPDFPLTLR